MGRSLHGNRAEIHGVDSRNACSLFSSILIRIRTPIWYVLCGAWVMILTTVPADGCGFLTVCRLVVLRSI